jgi:hypothetical protein
MPLNAKACVPASAVGLPGGIISNPKKTFWYILEGLGRDNVGKFCGHLEYFTTNNHFGMIRGHFCTFCGHLVIFSLFGKLYQ